MTMLPALRACLPRRVGSSLGSGVVCLRPRRVIGALRPLGGSEAGAVVVVDSRLRICRKIQWLLSPRDLVGSRRRLERAQSRFMIRTCSPRLNRYVNGVSVAFRTGTDEISQLAESDFAAQARVHASIFGQNLQTGVRGAADQFNKFVEGDEARADGRRNRVEPERRDFWDDFSSLGEQEISSHRRSASQRSQRSDVVGTAAMRKGPTASSLANSGAEAGDGKNTSSATGKGKDDWDENW
jgi:hypothetical protein